MKRLIFIGLLIMMVFVAGCGSLDQSAMNETYKSYWFKPSEIVNDTPSIDDLTIIDYEPPIKDYYRIGSFNLQIFGVTKSHNIPVTQALDKILSSFDLVVVQEIRDKSEQSFPTFMEDYMPEYQYHVSERVGRTSSKESTAFVWKYPVQVSNFTMFPDDFDVFEREPEMGLVQIGQYKFIMVVIHTKPTDTRAELEALFTDVVDYAEDYYKIDDIVIGGDVNNDCVYGDGTYPDGFTSYINNMDTTTTNSVCNYDRIYSTTEYNWTGGVLNYTQFDFPDGLVEAVSDHIPIFVEFPK